MSVRTEPRDLSQQLQQTLSIPADVMAAAGHQQRRPICRSYIYEHIVQRVSNFSVKAKTIIRALPSPRVPSINYKRTGFRRAVYRTRLLCFTIK